MRTPHGLADRTFIVTGGTRGLGEEVAREVARRGAAGITICGRDRARGEQVAAELDAAGCPTLFVAADLARVDNCRTLVAAHRDRFGGLFGLANVAASTARGTIDDTTPEQFDAMFDLNVRAPFFLMQDSLPLMRAGGGGSIVNILSMSAHGGQPFITAYCASKGALANLTKNVANAVRRDHIRVNGINMGWMATPTEHEIQLKDGNPENWLEKADADSPFGRILRPPDVARLTTYLFSDATEMMTGSIIDFDQNVMGTYE